MKKIIDSTEGIFISTLTGQTSLSMVNVLYCRCLIYFLSHIRPPTIYHLAHLEYLHLPKF